MSARATSQSHLDAAVGGGDAWGRFRRRGGQLLVDAAILVAAYHDGACAGRPGDVVAINVRGGPPWVFALSVFAARFDAAPGATL